MWIYANSENLTIAKFFEEIKHYMAISMFVATAKQDLNTVIMWPIKSVNKYYHRLFKLYEHTNMLNDKQINKFKLILKPAISHALLTTKYNTMRDLLKAAKFIEDQKKKISTNFPQE